MLKICSVTFLPTGLKVIIIIIFLLDVWMQSLPLGFILVI